MPINGVWAPANVRCSNTGHSQSFPFHFSSILPLLSGALVRYDLAMSASPKKAVPQKQANLSYEVPEGTKSYRTSLTLPADLAVGLNHLAKQLGISQSALVTALLSQAIPNLQKLVSLADSDGTEQEKAKRFRGASIDYVLDAVKKALKAM